MTGVITRAPPVPAPGLPGRVRIYEVGPRAGLQNEQGVIPVEVKEEFVRRLLAAGLPVVEATSFVHPPRSLRPPAIISAGPVAGAAAAVVSQPADVLLSRLCGSGAVSDLSACVNYMQNHLNMMETKRRPVDWITVNYMVCDVQYGG